MADLITSFGWTWIAVVAIDDSYGRFGFAACSWTGRDRTGEEVGAAGLQALKQALHERGICLATEILTEPEGVGAALGQLAAVPAARVAVLIWPGVTVEQVFKVRLTSHRIASPRNHELQLKKALDYNLTDKTWIASESWGYRSFAVLPKLYEARCKAFR